MISFGINQVEVSGGDSWMREADMRKCMIGIKDLGATDIRMACVWQFIESARGRFNWAPLDRAVNMAREYGLEPTLILQFPAPSWGAGAGSFGNFASKVAARYGSAGTNQVQNFEIMNEMNMILNLSPPTAAQYAPYLKAAYLGIKSVYPTGSNVITGGVMACVSGFFNVDAAAFCKGLYKQGCKDYFDTMGWHWYSNTPGFEWEAPSDTQLFYREMLDVRDRMVAEGDSAKSLWVTELGVPYPMVSAANGKEWIQTQVELLNALPWVGKWFLYNYRNTGKDLGNANNQFGVVDFMYNKKQPLYDYVASISPNGVIGPFTGAGALQATVRQKVAADFAGSGDLGVVANPVRMAYFSGSGQLTAELFGRPTAKYTGTGSFSAVVISSYSCTAAFTGEGELSATASDKVYRDANLTGAGDLMCSVGQQQFFSHVFSGTTKPSTFTDFGTWPYTVSSSIARNGTPTSDGRFTSGGIYNTDHYSENHYSEVTLGNLATAYDRSAMAIVRSDPAGLNWVGATMRASGSSAGQIITCIGGVREERATNGTGGGDGDRLGIGVEGNVYTVYKNGNPTGLTWTDFSGIFPGTFNKRTGFGFQHARSNGASYGTSGVRQWSANDLYPSVTGTAEFGGSGELSAVVAQKVSAPFVGAGSLTATSEIADGPRLALLGGGGSLTATASERYSVTAPFTGAGAYTGVVRSALADFSGAGSLSASVLTGVTFDSFGGSASTSTLNDVVIATPGVGYSDAGTVAIVTMGVSSQNALSSKSVKYGSYSMMLLDSARQGVRTVLVWALFNPPTGPVNVTCASSASGGTVQGSKAQVLFYRGVGGISDITHATFTTGTTRSITVDTLAGGMTVLASAAAANSSSVSGTLRDTSTAALSGINFYLTCFDGPGTGSPVTNAMTYSSSSVSWAGVSFGLDPV